MLPKPDSLHVSLDPPGLKILERRTEEGSLYSALHRLKAAGWVRARWTTNGARRRARIYDITTTGRTQLAAEETRWCVATSAVNRVLRTV